MDRSTGLSYHDEDLAVTNPEVSEFGRSSSSTSCLLPFPPLLALVLLTSVDSISVTPGEDEWFMTGSSDWSMDCHHILLQSSRQTGKTGCCRFPWPSGLVETGGIASRIPFASLCQMPWVKTIFQKANDVRGER
jgi:hypothetical protein